MKAKMMLMSTLALALGALTSCISSGGGKTKIGVLQFGSFEALEKAKQGFVDTLNKSDLAGSFEIDVKNAMASSADNTSMAGTLASTSDLLYGIATPSASALKNAAESIASPAPILFSAVTNAVGANLVKDEKKPTNCTGVLDIGPIDQELDILSKFPDMDKVVSLFTSTEVNSVYQVEIAEAWMREHDISFDRKAITSASEIGSALAAIDSSVDAIFLPTDDTIANAIAQVKAANEARTDKLLIVGSDTGLADACTFAMGVDYYQCGVQAGNMAVDLLKKNKTVGQIPVERCDASSIVINKTLAESLGQTIPAEVLAIEGAKII